MFNSRFTGDQNANATGLIQVPEDMPDLPEPDQAARVLLFIDGRLALPYQHYNITPDRRSIQAAPAPRYTTFDVMY